MRIGITINEVLRDFVGQLAYTYDKYLGPFEIKQDEVTSFNLIDHFPFKTLDEMNRFLYKEAALEVFGHADQMHEHIITKFNEFHMDIKDEEEHEIVIIDREVAKSIPSTFFFLSKLGCQIENIKFVDHYEKIWSDVDLLITANPILLGNKPEGKLSIKVNASYNADAIGDFEMDDLFKFMNDEDFRDMVLNTKITNYEEF